VCEEVGVEILAERESRQDTADEGASVANSELARVSAYDTSDASDTSDGSRSTDLTSDENDEGEEEEKTSFEHVFPMSSSQARMWFPYQLLQDKTTYNCTTSYRLRGPLDVGRYENALKAVIRKHQTLRTSFYTDPYSGDSMQAVAKISPFRLKKVANANENVDSAKETSAVAKHVYDLEHHDVFIATLLTYGPEYHEIIFGYHHIIMDGVSWQLFLQETERFYVNPPRSLFQHDDYIDFTVKQRANLDSTSAPATQAKRDFWKSCFEDLPPPMPLFPFARAGSRKALNRYNATETFIELDQSLVARMKAVPIDNKSTTFHFYLTALQIMTRRLLKIDDICIGSELLR
jgi:hypothetical protein